MIWPTTTFGSLYEEPSRNGIYKSKEFHGTGTRMVNMGELFAFPFISNQEMKRLTLTDVELDKFQLQKGDLLFARRSLIESGAGKCVLVETHDEPMVFESSIIRVRLQQKQCDPRFYYYYFLSPVGRGRIRAIVTGAAQKGIRGSELQNIEVHNPKIEIQERIADILSAYDDLIDNNNRRIALLEEAIHRLYCEWFVHLRFPGHEHTPVVAGVPQGWEKRPLGEVVNVNPKTNYEKGKPSPYVPMAAVSEKSMIISGTEERPIKGGPKFVNGDTLLARITPCLENGKTGFVQFLETDEIVASGSTEFIVLREGVLSRYWIYCLARTHEFRQHAINSMVGSDGRQRVQPVSVMGYQVPVPPKPIVSDFGDYAQKIFKQINTLNRQNGKLREARDALLPRLMNGSLPV